MTIKPLVEKYISERPLQVGQTVQFGWFIFRIAELGKPPRIETLDFRRIASFTQDFSEVERIHALQSAALVKFHANEGPCTLQQSALVSVSYSPGRTDVFVERQSPTDANDSGWYVGIFNDSRDMNDINSFARRSLYELTIQDMRLAPYWLLPLGTIISLATQQIHVAKTQTHCNSLTGSSQSPQIMP